MRSRNLSVDTSEVGVGNGLGISDVAASISTASCKSAPSSPSFSFRRRQNNKANASGKSPKPSGRRKQRRSQSVGDDTDISAADMGKQERPASLCSLPDYKESSNSPAVGRKRELVKSMVRGRRGNTGRHTPTSNVGTTQPDKSTESLSVAELSSSGIETPNVAVADPPPPEEGSPPQLLVVPSREAIPVPDESAIEAMGNEPLISILHHSFISSCMPSCGDYNQIVPSPTYGQIVQSPTERTHDEEARLEHRLEDIEDPTVQESIECVFAHQLDDGLEGFFDDDDDANDESCQDEWNKAEEGQSLPSPSSSTNHFRFLDSSASRSRASSIGSASTMSANDKAANSKRTQRNRSAVASVLGVPHPLAHSASSDAELVASARRTASAPDGLGLPPRPFSTSNSASRSNAMGAGLPPKPTMKTMKRGATTGSLRRFDGGDDLAAHELRRRTWSRRVLDSKRLVFIGTIGGEAASLADAAIADELEQSSNDSSACPSCRGQITSVPHAPPHFWPQAPLLLRPTPGSGTTIRGIRYSGSDQYLWKPTFNGHNHTESETIPCWSDYLQSSWHGHQPTPGRPAVCAECAPIPVNNGNELPGESLVVDFESDLFIGSLLVRIRKSQGTTPAPYDDSFGYFSGMNRRYQTVVRGMFKRDEIAMTNCITGQVLNRKCGKLPPKLVLCGAVKIISYFAPQLKVKLDTDKPYSISPLGSTPQVLQLKRTGGYDANYQADESIESNQEEPTDVASSLLSLMGFEPSNAPTSIARARVRKRHFDKLYAENDKSLVFDRSTEYSFESLQHLIDFDDFSVDLGSIAGKVFLKELLDGQPLKLMAAKRRDVMCDQCNKGQGLDLDYLWSFDIFHEAVYEDCR